MFVGMLIIILTWSSLVESETDSPTTSSTGCNKSEADEMHVYTNGVP